MPDMPSGTVAFLFTDIEGSTRRWQQAPREMAAAVARHDALLNEVIASHGGSVFKTVGDAFCAVFPTVSPAVSAALDAQRALAAEPWGEVGAIKARMAVHAGEAEERDNDYFGPAVNRVARLLSAGHGGQILLSHSATELVRDTLLTVAQLRDMGEHRLKDLTRPEHIFQVVVPDLPSDFPPIVTLDHRPNNLPPQLTTLVGREHQVTEILDKLARDGIRLVTLTGPGGVGKTRLGLQVGSEALNNFPDGVWFVPLEEASKSEGIVAALARALGVREVGGQPILQTLTEYLREKNLLIILDNFEQVAHAAPLVSRLLTSAHRLRALVTSRTRLGLQGEHEIVVPPLEVPDRDAIPPATELLGCSAVRLFVERAHAASSRFSLTDTNAGAITEICRGLDALPLAIELAAARVKLLPPEALLSRMERRLGLLTGGRGDRPARHQTLRAAIAWSYDLLAPEEQVLFARLAVFASGFTLDAAETVCNPEGDLDLLTGLESLVDHSLVRQSPETEEDLRFSMLTTIRDYAAERLAEAPGDTTPNRHVAWCLDLLQQAEPALRGREQQTWLAQLEREHDNLRAALAWSQSTGHHADHLRLAGGMFPFWEMRGYFSEGRKWLSSALTADPDVPPTILARAQRGLASLMTHQGDYDEAVRMFQHSLTICRQRGDSHGAAESLAGLASVALRQGDHLAATPLFEESLSLFGEAGDAWGEAGVINGLAAVAHEEQDYARAQSLYQEALATFQRVADGRNMAITLNNLATVAHDGKDYGRAIALYDQSLALTRLLEDKRTSAMALNNQAIVAHDQGDYQRATALYEESLALFRHLGDRRGIAYLLLGLGIIADDQGDHQRARALHEESLSHFQAMGDRRGIASALTTVAATTHHEGDDDRAESLYHEALAYRKGSGDQEGIVECLDGLAAIAVSRGETERGVRLLAAGSGFHDREETSMSPARRNEYDLLLRGARASLGDDAFDSAWEAGNALSLEDAASEVLQGHLV
jgi:predicted ATPase/class 3 adenylate cyclase/Tfp pilus assembly protein PilF